jgi:hypothetical protein
VSAIAAPYLTDAEFACLDPLLPPAHDIGRPRLHPQCEILGLNGCRRLEFVSGIEQGGELCT